MQELHYTEKQAADNISALFKGSRLIPFFGAGFTKGHKSKNGKVPDAKLLTKIITSLAASKAGLSSEEIQQIKEIQDLKTAFELLSSSEYITPNQAQALLGNLFSKVSNLDNDKNRLLDLDWPHIFSFNIDDAIENKTRRYRTIIPNREVSREFINSNNCLFKIHGDINEFTAYNDPNLVFTWREYAHSIENNKAMLSFLEDQSKHSAFLFLGCSLDAEVDLLHLSRNTKFSNSIYLKRGKLTVKEKIVLKSYGIEQVIVFDNYEEMCPWLVQVLGNVSREVPFQDISIDDSVVKDVEAIRLIANGGPLMLVEASGHRTARKPQNFADRSALTDAVAKLRSHECILVTGRRFSGKTLFLFQLIDAMKHYASNFYASTDVFHPGVKRLVAGAENTLFIFDSNYLNSQSLDEILHARLPASSKLIICASGGDAEIFRFKLEDRNITFSEIKLRDFLDGNEGKLLNNGLTSQGLPNYKKPEKLLDFAFRYYSEFKGNLEHSSIFDKNVDNLFFSVMVLVSAFGKAESEQLECLFKYFDPDAFVSENDRVFEVERAVGGRGYVITCNSSAWLITMLGQFISRNRDAVEIVSSIIISLARDGFNIAARNLISFDKLNELGNAQNTGTFIRGVYLKIQALYSHDQHYWLQRSKCELISGHSLEDFESGMSYASKVRLDCGNDRNQTYFSATLVMAQLCIRSYTLSKQNSFLLRLLDYFLESIENYDNNKRHMNKVISSYFDRKSNVRLTLDALSSAIGVEFLQRRNDVRTLTNFFEMHRNLKSN